MRGYRRHFRSWLGGYWRHRMCYGSRCRRRRGPRGFRFRGRGLRLFLSFCSSFVVRQLLKVLPHEHGVINIDRTRVRLLFGDTDFGKVINQYLRFDFQLSRQLVNSDLIRV